MIRHFGDNCSHCASLVYDFLPEIDHHRIAFVSLEYAKRTQPEQVCKDFKKWLKDVQQLSPAKVVICGVSEGLVPWSKDFINTLVAHLGINVCDIIYISSAVCSDETIQTFHDYLGYPVRILFYNHWQDMVVSHNTNVRDWTTSSRVDRCPDKKFLCYNGSPRPHRLALLYHITRLGYLHHGLISAHLESHIEKYEHFEKALRHTFPDIATEATNLLVKEKVLPRLLDADMVSLKNGIDGHSQLYLKIDHYEQTRFSIITETAYSNKSVSERLRDLDINVGGPTIPCAFPTEKTFKAILGRHPFVMISTAGMLSHLRHLGYMTFEPYIDESYDRIEDDQERMLAALDQIQRLCELDDSQWHKFQQQVEHIVEHNVRHLINQARTKHAQKSWILTSHNNHVIIDRNHNKHTRHTHEKSLD